MAATKTPDIVGFVISFILLLLLVSFQTGVAEAKRNLRQERFLESPLPPTAPIYLPPSKSRRGRGP
ncbi:serine rich endogenous peptide 13 [Raphanus sativus]|uniref:Serine rich endogenous peptide 13 n=1 Tax=Raphanus sativus TaxID=3726 RepID=A0A6J0K0X3_RAPSA|nr:serine rich endogenous peptide 13 [Raphanus sativus]